MILTARQLEALRQLIVDHHQAFVVNYVSPSLVSDATKERLKRLGLLKPEAKTVEDAYVLGMVAAKAPDAGDSLTFRQLRDQVAKQPIPLGYAEKAAISAAQMSAGQYITGLGSRVAGAVGSMVLDAAPGPTEAEAYLAQVKDAVANTIRDRRTLKQLKSDLGHATKDWTRDLERVANTELGNAMSSGTAQKAVRDFGSEVLVYKARAPGCCKWCRKLWCRPSSDIPLVYKLADLEANGSNVGRKARDWLPTVEITHCNCRCILMPLPLGMTLNANGQMVAAPRSAGKKSP